MKICCIICTFLLQTIHLTQGGEVPCGGKPSDVVFALDTSNSIWRPDFRRQLTFVKDVIDLFPIGADDMRVGVVTFSDYTQPWFNLDTYHRKQNIMEAVGQVYQDGGVYTITSDAIRYMREESFGPSMGARENVTKVAIIITDGRSSDTEATRSEAEKARKQGIHMFAVGVGNRVDNLELIAIANRPTDDYMFKVDGYAGLENIKELLAIKTCTVTDPPTTPAPTTTPIPTTTTTKPPPTTTPTTTTTTTTTKPPPTTTPTTTTTTTTTKPPPTTTPTTTTTTATTKPAPTTTPTTTTTTTTTTPTTTTTSTTPKTTHKTTTRSTTVASTSASTTTRTTTTTTTTSPPSTTALPEVRTVRFLTRPTIINHGGGRLPLWDNQVGEFKGRGEGYAPLPGGGGENETKGKRKRRHKKKKNHRRGARVNGKAGYVEGGVHGGMTEDGGKLFEDLMQQALNDEGCKPKGAVDIAFVIDTKHGGEGHNRRMLNFVRSAVSNIEMLDGNVRLRFVYECSSVEGLKLDATGSKHTLLNEIDKRMRVPRTTSQLMHEMILKLSELSEKHKNRTEIRKVGVYITDGVSNDLENTLMATQEAKLDNDIEIYGVGVGDRISQTELNAFVSCEPYRHLYRAKHYSRLKTTAKKLARQLCR